MTERDRDEPGDPEVPARGILWAGRCPMAVRAFRESPMTSSSHRPKP